MDDQEKREVRAVEAMLDSLVHLPELTQKFVDDLKNKEISHGITKEQHLIDLTDRLWNQTPMGSHEDSRPQSSKVIVESAVADRRRELDAQLDNCFCDDGRGLPECPKCVVARAELGAELSRDNWAKLSKITPDDIKMDYDSARPISAPIVAKSKQFRLRIGDVVLIDPNNVTIITGKEYLVVTNDMVVLDGDLLSDDERNQKRDLPNIVDAHNQIREHK